MSFHNLCNELTPPLDLRPLLGLGHKFIPNPRYTNGPREISDINNPRATLSRFERSLRVRCFFADQAGTVAEPVEGEPEPDEGPPPYNPRMYVPSQWTPPRWTYPRIVQNRFHNFRIAVTQLYRATRTRGRSNLLPHQRRALQWAQTQDDFVVCLTDKNLGFCILEKSQYIRRARSLLADPLSYYQFEDEMDARLYAAGVEADILQWIRQYRHSLTREEAKYIRRHLRQNRDPFATFYLLIKVHKNPIGQRPVVSYSGSLLEALAVWCDDKLQPLAKAQKSYLQSSFALKEQLEALDLPPNAVLFTADARAMYTNIPTEECLQSIRVFLQENFAQFTHVDHEALLAALEIVMSNNIFRFGDTWWRQNNGAAMGAPPCPPWAQLYFAPAEDDSCDVFSDFILFFKRYIDDIFGIWLRQPGDDAAWELFKAHINQGSALVWDFSERATTATFLDLTITVQPTGRISTDLYEKPLNLHAYLPPHSAHPPGVLKGLVKGMIYRFMTLCSNQNDQRRHVNQFLNHLLVRGYNRQGLVPIFNQALRDYAGTPADPVPPQLRPQRPLDVHPLFLHIQYHPNDPPSTILQRLWRTKLFRPPGSRLLSDLDSSHRRGKIGTNRMITCYSRAPNLENLVSSKRDLHFRNGPTVSSFFQPND